MCQILDRQLRHNTTSENQIQYILILHIVVLISNSTKILLQLLSPFVETAELIQLLHLLLDPLCFILAHCFLAVTFLSLSPTSARQRLHLPKSWCIPSLHSGIIGIYYYITRTVLISTFTVTGVRVLSLFSTILKLLKLKKAEAFALPLIGVRKRSPLRTMLN